MKKLLAARERDLSAGKQREGGSMEFGYGNIVTGVVIVCVDRYENDEMSGRLYHFFDEVYTEFHSILDMVKKLECLLDRMQMPKRSMEDRHFIQNTENILEENEVFDIHNLKRPVICKGKKATFAVRVVYRQNASWQGQVIWEEKKKKLSFRSTLELMKLMDNALGTESSVCRMEQRG